MVTSPTKVSLPSAPKNTMILTNFKSNFNINIFLDNYSHSYLNNYLQKEYDESTALMNINSLECPYCHEYGFSYHAYYIRHIYIFGKKYTIRITRVICRHCHKTHAILIEDIIPYSQIRFEDILYMLKNKTADFIDMSHLSYILKKYTPLSSITYKNICIRNRRKYICMFLST